MIIVKIGGGGAVNIPGIIEDLAGLDEPYVIVHGANALRNWPKTWDSSSRC